MPLASWLFIKDQGSIWIERPFARTLIIAGPGVRRGQHDFTTEADLEAFQISTAERLAEGGWLLWAFDEDRRRLKERRSAGRGPNDRRRSDLESGAPGKN
jgi:hypothetical protein